jgi:hypothetical protein
LAVDVDPILVSLVALAVAMRFVDRWLTTRRLAATACQDCGQPLGREAARRRRALQFVCRTDWALTCLRCGAGQVILSPPIRRSFRD